jgi:hypothetical protein
MVAVGVKEEDDAAAGSRGQVFFGKGLIVEGIEKELGKGLGRRIFFGLGPKDTDADQHKPPHKAKVSKVCARAGDGQHTPQP